MATARLEELRAKFEENPRRFFAPFANELRKSGEAAQAIAICRTHLAGQPGHVSGHIVLAQALHDSGAFDEASREFQAALEVDPENMIALRAVGDICAAQGDFDGARSWYARVLDVDPRNEEMRELLRTLPEPTVVEDATPEQGAAQLTAAEEDGAEDIAPEAALTGTLDFLPPEARADAAGDVAPSSLATESFSQSLEVADEAVEEIELSESFFSEPLEAAISSPSEQPQEPTAPVEPGAFVARGPALGGGDLESSADTLEMELPDAVQGPGPDAGELDFDHRASADTSTADLASADATVDLPAEWFTPATPAPAAEPDMSSADWSLPEPRSSAAFAPEMPEESVMEPASHEDDTVWRPKPTPAAVHSDFEAAPDDWFAPPGESTLEREAEALANTEIESIAAPRDDMASWFPVAAGDAAPTAETDGTVEASSADRAIPPTDADAEHVPAPSASPEVAESDTAEAAADDAAPEVAAPAADSDLHLELQAVHVTGAIADDVSTPLTEASPPPEVAEEALAARLTSEAWDAEPLRDRVTPAVSTAFAEASTTPFVTETLAELYVQQGFREEALSIYRQLILARPADAALRLRAEEIEGMLTSAAAESGGTAAATARTPSSPAAGMSARGFFSRLATRKPGRAGTLPRNGAPGPAGHGAGAVASPSPAPNELQSAPSSAEALSNMAPPERRDIARGHDAAVRSAIARHTPSALSALFPASNPSDADLAAATNLASAFSDPPSDGRPSGRPAKAVDRELSLDHLFRDIVNPTAPGVTLDSFFDSAGRGSTSGDAPHPQPPQGDTSADLQQFTRWLEGLKQK